MFGIGFLELFLILIVGLLIFGPKRLPEIARTVGKAMYQFRHASASFTQEIGKEWHRLEVDVQEKEDGENGPEVKDGDKGAQGTGAIGDLAIQAMQWLSRGR